MSKQIQVMDRLRQRRQMLPANADVITPPENFPREQCGARVELDELADPPRYAVYFLDPLAMRRRVIRDVAAKKLIEMAAGDVVLVDAGPPGLQLWSLCTVEGEASEIGTDAYDYVPDAAETVRCENTD